MLSDEYRGLPTETKTEHTSHSTEAFCVAHINSISICAKVVATVTLELVATTSPQSTYDFVCPSIKITNLLLDE